MAEKTKYSKDELEVFRAIINEKADKAKEDLQLLVDQLSHKMTTELMTPLQRLS